MRGNADAAAPTPPELILPHPPCGPPLPGGEGLLAKVPPMPITARDYRTEKWVELEPTNGRIASIAPCQGPETIAPEDDWIAPAFWDIQTNGRWGYSFSSPDLTVDQVIEVVLAQASLGT